MDPTETTGGTGDAAPARAGLPPVVWPAVGVGAAIGLVVVAAVATTRAVLDRRVEDFGRSGWTLPLAVVLLGGYFAAGWVAQRRAAEAGVADAPLTHGALAGITAVVVWVPLRALIWLARGEDRGLVRGGDAALRPGQVLGALVIAAAVGLVGAWSAAWVASRRGRATPSPSDDR